MYGEKTIMCLKSECAFSGEVWGSLGFRCGNIDVMLCFRVLFVRRQGPDVEGGVIILIVENRRVNGSLC